MSPSLPSPARGEGRGGRIALQRCGKAHECGGDLPRRVQPRGEVAGNLGFPAAPAAVIDRDFRAAQAARGDPHLHFQIPAIGRLGHAEHLQRFRPHGAERRHVGEPGAIDDAQQQAREKAGRDLLRRQAARFATAAQAGAHDEIRLIVRHRRDDGADEGRDIAAVAVKEADDLRARLDGGEARSAGPAIAAPRTRGRPAHRRPRRVLRCGPWSRCRRR